MNTTPFSHERFDRIPLIGIIRDISFDDVRAILPIYQQAGLTTLEVTMNTTDVEQILPYARAHFPSLNVGAGTVCTPGDLNKALDLGAQFIVTPVVVKKMIKSCKKLGIPIFPGAYTPSEIYTAWSLGATMVKIYPATALGPAYIKDLRGPLKNIPLMPTGGIQLDNIGAFRDAGANAFGIGSQLFNQKLIKEKDWQGLEKHFQAFVDRIKEA
ncbi:bifunctional 4-hydroxy-2-oxoglutarate aldolase/2-dehydro-3-deoxy-phosphogluconate aldolase [Olivibacter ginsenosidimutans]|uniref:Bifunctional 4-hydroxy-2-oxoglutarate aldolase/2-dehydro-3-deoxy-phosphogluconate aldolase n=1 Tax=Olivibacter ginsenosidimutans TaxID=1176537 RepID=A0ABP9AUE4_9SPHI